MAIKQLSGQTKGIRSVGFAQTLGPGRGWEKKNKEGDAGEGPWLQETKQNTLNCKSRCMRQQTVGSFHYTLSEMGNIPDFAITYSQTLPPSIRSLSHSLSLSFSLNLLSLSFLFLKLVII